MMEHGYWEDQAVKIISAVRRQVTDLEPEICAALRESLQETRRRCVEIRAFLGFFRKTMRS